MTDQELLQAIGQVVETKMEPMRQDICTIKEDVQVLRKDVRALQENYTKLERRIGNLEGRIGSLEGRVGGLEERIGGLEERVGGLEERVGGLEGRVGSLEEKVTGIRVYIDADLDRTLKLLLEGQKAVWDRATPPERYDALEVRTSALEMAVKQHSQEIQELKLA